MPCSMIHLLRIPLGCASLIQYVSAGKLPTEAVYTAQVTTRMCANDDSKLVESPSSGQTVGTPGNFQYIINALQEGYTPIDDVCVHTGLHLVCAPKVIVIDHR